MGALHLPQSKNNAEKEGAVIVYVDEASFRQSPTLHQTWAPRNQRPEIPTRGERNTQKVLGPSVCRDLASRIGTSLRILTKSRTARSWRKW